MSKPFNKKDPDDVNFLVVIIFAVSVIMYSCYNTGECTDTVPEETPQ